MKKKTHLLAILLSAVTLIAVSVCMYHHNHPTHYRFNDSFIIGSTLEDITEKYGDFDRRMGDVNDERFSVYYMIHADTPELIFDGRDNSRWYGIHFEDGIAAKVYVMDGWYGG